MTNTPMRDLMKALAYIDDVSKFYDIVDGIIQDRLAKAKPYNYESALAEAVQQILQEAP